MLTKTRLFMIVHCARAKRPLSELKLSQHLMTHFLLFCTFHVVFNNFYVSYVLVWLFQWIAKFFHNFSFSCNVYLWMITMNTSVIEEVDTTHLNQWDRSKHTAKETHWSAFPVTQEPGDIIFFHIQCLRGHAQSLLHLYCNWGKGGKWMWVKWVGQHSERIPVVAVILTVQTIISILWMGNHQSGPNMKP